MKGNAVFVAGYEPQPVLNKPKLPDGFQQSDFLVFIFKIKKILKSLLNLLQYCFCCMLCFFGLKACGILAPLPGIEPVPPALEGEVLTTRL